ncbi:hypothetical protein RCCS2_15369 [Roseobacter sp. CCS2]|nr:hypothetical protein RCCS2_15369 [Roseobacter sp. CCS2]
MPAVRGTWNDFVASRGPSVTLLRWWGAQRAVGCFAPRAAVALHYG